MLRNALRSNALLEQDPTSQHRDPLSVPSHTFGFAQARKVCDRLRGDDHARLHRASAQNWKSELESERMNNNSLYFRYGFSYLLLADSLYIRLITGKKAIQDGEIKQGERIQRDSRAK